jgi:hypothetical protein
MEEGEVLIGGEVGGRINISEYGNIRGLSSVDGKLRCVSIHKLPQAPSPMLHCSEQSVKIITKVRVQVKQSLYRPGQALRVQRV